jgi:hypothetical protein
MRIRRGLGQAQIASKSLVAIAVSCGARSCGARWSGREICPITLTLVDNREL